METNEIPENEEAVEIAESIETGEVVEVEAAPDGDAGIEGTLEVAEEAGEAEEAVPDEQRSEFQKVKDRLQEIANLVDSDEVSLDEALDLYEEAVVLGLQATDMLDVGITAQEEAQARMLGENAGESNEAAAEGAASENPTAAPATSVAPVPPAPPAPGIVVATAANKAPNAPESHDTTAADESQVS